MAAVLNTEDYADSVTHAYGLTFYTPKHPTSADPGKPL
jgi:hypothetical protein